MPSLWLPLMDQEVFTQCPSSCDKFLAASQPVLSNSVSLKSVGFFERTSSRQTIHVLAHVSDTADILLPIDAEHVTKGVMRRGSLESGRAQWCSNRLSQVASRGTCAQLRRTQPRGSCQDSIWNGKQKSALGSVRLSRRDWREE